MSEADESYDGAMKRAHRAEHDLATLTIQHDTAAALLRQSRARVAELEAELAKATGEDHSADPHEECADKLRAQYARAEKAERERDSELELLKEEVKLTTLLKARTAALYQLAEDCYGVATCERSYYEELGERLRKAKR